MNIENLTFGEALEALQNGKVVGRATSKEPFYLRLDKSQNGRHVLIIIKNGVEAPKRFISTSDLIAEDWFIN